VLVVVKPVYEFHFARYYGNHMVLQRAPSRAVIWGYGPFISDNTSVTVILDNNSTRRVVYHTTVKYTGCDTSLTVYPCHHGAACMDGSRQEAQGARAPFKPLAGRSGRIGSVLLPLPVGFQMH